MQPADTVSLSAACTTRGGLISWSGPDTDVQPTDESDAGRQTRRPAVQEPFRLSVEDAQNRGAIWLVQGSVNIVLRRDTSAHISLGSTAHLLRIVPHTSVPMVPQTAMY